MSTNGKEGYVYAARERGDVDFFVKFGRTNNIQKRLSALNTASKQRAEDIYFYRTLYVIDMVKAERSLHSLFAQYRIRESREWFKLDNSGMLLLHQVFNTLNTTITYRDLLLLRSLGLRDGTVNEGDVI